MLYLVLLLAPLIITSSASFQEITSLPGVSHNINFKQYSGYVDVSSNHHLHYWFVESQGNASTDPLIFWFNGGPGCSSLYGLLKTMGPFNVAKTGNVLTENVHSWNKLANIVYIEAPAGVGFSYSSDGNTTTNDDLTAIENYAAVKGFYADFPQFLSNPTYILGSSYAGVYVPTLTAAIVEGQSTFPINLQGMAIGNAFFNRPMRFDATIRYAYGHGIVDQVQWDYFNTECCAGEITTCDLSAFTGTCASMVNQIIGFLWTGGMNPYNIFKKCDNLPITSAFKVNAFERAPDSYFGMLDTPSHKFARADVVTTTAAPITQPPCNDDSEVIAYLNQPSVRTALGIPSSVKAWNTCDDTIGGEYIMQHRDMSPYVMTAITAGVKVLLYFGDADTACPFLMGQKFANGLGLNRTQAGKPWKFEGQVAGFKTLFDQLTFLTILGAGHNVPHEKGSEMYYVMNNFINDLTI